MNVPLTSLLDVGFVAEGPPKRDPSPTTLVESSPTQRRPAPQTPAAGRPRDPASPIEIIDSSIRRVKAWIRNERRDRSFPPARRDRETRSILVYFAFTHNTRSSGPVGGSCAFHRRARPEHRG